MNKQQIQDKIRNSAFSASSAYVVDVHLSRFLVHLMQLSGLEVDSSEAVTADDIFQAVPSFQRDNDKWTVEMQINFIEKIICGYRTSISLYELKSAEQTFSSLDDCKILDGLQRITAIYKFLTGQIKAFGKTYKELSDDRIITATSVPINIKVFSFTSEEEAISFYIEINENITHSKADIDKAKKILATIQQLNRV